jgi:cytoskeletal protein RodZ
MLGEELKRRREERSISLEEISETTRIGTRFLKAIETGNYSVLPGAIYTRSFIRAYARRVGLDEQEALAMYQQEAGASEGPLSDPEETRTGENPIPLTGPSRGLLPTALVTIVAALILGSGGWAIWHYLNRAPALPAEPAVGETAPASAAATVPATPVSAGRDRLTLTLEAKGTCWIKYSVDNGEPTQLMLQKGETRSIEATASIDLSVGNTQAITMRINDREARFPDNTPIVLKRLTITPETASSLLD